MLELVVVLSVLLEPLELVVLDTVVVFPILKGALLTTSVVESAAELVVVVLPDIGNEAENELGSEVGSGVGNEAGSEEETALLSGTKGVPHVDVSTADGTTLEVKASVDAATVSEASTVKGSPHELVCADAMPRRDTRMVFCSSDCFIVAFGSCCEFDVVGTCGSDRERLLSSSGSSPDYESRSPFDYKDTISPCVALDESPRREINKEALPAFYRPSRGPPRNLCSAHSPRSSVRLTPEVHLTPQTEASGVSTY